MEYILCRTFLVIFILESAVCQRDPRVCTVPTESNGLLPPPLPTDFVLWQETVNLLNTSLQYEEFYFDYSNQRGKYVIVTNGIEKHVIYDYENEQIIVYDNLYPGVKMERNPLSEACAAVPMKNTFLRRIFGYKEGQKNRMNNGYELLKFGGPYKYSSKGSVNLETRGLKTNLFGGCIYDKDMNVTAAISHYFSDKFINPAGGTMEYDVDGLENAEVLSVPLQVEFRGVVSINKGSKPVTTNFHMQGSIPYFKGKPDFDYNRFNIPPLIYCKNYKGRKDMPTLPTAFSTRMETSVFTQDMSGKNVQTQIYQYKQIWYHKDKRLARADRTPMAGKDGEIHTFFGNYGPVKMIYDFNIGIVYITNKASGRCLVRAIHNGEYFDTSKEETLTMLGSPEELFRMERDKMEYKGKDFVRGIETDVWIGTYFNRDLNLTEYRESYFTAGDWHEIAEEQVEFGVPIRHVIIINHEDGEFLQTLEETNFFKFKIATPPLIMFDVTECMEGVEQKFFLIVLAINDDTTKSVEKYRWHFQQEVSYFLANATDVRTPLRIQKVNFIKVVNYKLLKFAITGKTKLTGRDFYAQAGASIDDAAHNLRQFIDDGKFILIFKPRGTDQTIEVLAEPGSLYQLPSPESVSQKAFPVETETVTKEYDIDRRIRWDEPKSKIVYEKGMSSGGLATLAIAMLIIGAGIGIILMICYSRRFNIDNITVRYHADT